MEMQDRHYLTLAPRPTPMSLHAMFAVVRRQRRLIAGAFAAVMLGSALVIWLTPAQYQAEMKILVRRERVDPLVTADASSQSRNARGLTEQEVNSEVDLLKSGDLLEQVVKAEGLHEAAQSGPAAWLGIGAPSDDERQRVAYAVRSLKDKLKLSPPNKSNLIQVSYRSKDPERAARVLNTLADRYMEKHLSVHRVAGTFEFFQQQAEQHRHELERLQQELVEFGRRESVVAPQAQKQSALEKIAQFEASEREVQTSILAAEQRVASLRAQAAAVPSRVTTQVRLRSDVLSQLNSTLYDLQLKRTELLTRYAPSYRAVRDLDEQIEQTRRAIAQAAQEPIREEVTDENPTYKWLDAELAKANSELAGLRARASGLRATVQTYRQEAQELDRKGLAQESLVRAARNTEEQYELYLKKQEEARVADALDHQRILNVALAEPATVPSLASSDGWAKLLASFLMACLVSLGFGFLKDYLDPSFRTVEEVRATLGVPVLAALPSPAPRLLGPGRASPDPVAWHSGD
jgi:uncharacterized protein involved in exopolysaccharide biosynthesis